MGLWDKLKEANPHKSLARGRELQAASINSVIPIPPEMADRAKVCDVCKITFGAMFAKHLAPYLVSLNQGTYLSFQNSEFLIVCTACIRNFGIYEEPFLNSASQSSKHDGDKSHTASPPFTKTSSNASSQQKTFLSNVSGGVLQCIGCKQLLNVPHGKKFKLSCPKCKLSWIHDGTKWR